MFFVESDSECSGASNVFLEFKIKNQNKFDCNISIFYKNTDKYRWDKRRCVTSVTQSLMPLTFMNLFFVCCKAFPFETLLFRLFGPLPSSSYINLWVCYSAVQPPYGGPQHRLSISRQKSQGCRHTIFLSRSCRGTQQTHILQNLNSSLIIQEIEIRSLITPFIKNSIHRTFTLQSSSTIA